MKVLLCAAILLTLAFPALAQSQFARAWPETDFTRSNVPFDEIFSGGVPRDGIPALTDPSFITVTQADIPADEPVMTVELDGEVPRAYPLRYLTWHEIVNDTIGTVPVAVTFCPLCNSGLVFDRRVGDRVLEFGVSGLLRHSDMVMYDRQTHSWWQQFTGDAIVGALTGLELTEVVSWMEPMGAFAERHSDGLVMAQPGAPRPYGVNPYERYDSSARPFLYFGEDPPHGIAPLARVVRVGDRAWPLERLESGLIEEAGLRIEWTAGMASALDQNSISGSRDVGFVRVRDADTGDDVVHEVVFAFAFHAFAPDGEWMLGE
ncbi:DUF3179 domain-containing protein [Pontivivens insulae]|uniref:DUF3179 domain-containing protein n=1 Tax=Pontivivens insulae TaxID=1639689 RepID=A0A2R8ABU9_9RHOB|nr:DUF3179 domain-containing protein [Pontivivens insulae]RED11119.1 uncharacterized protein DUF3179 [Pontivivens insulae]SPF29706.1 hypothetical protein POI8812_02022 [Pontivivens insulae]